MGPSGEEINGGSDETVKSFGGQGGMPAGFEKCRRAGGRIRTKKLSKGRYMHICFLNGKSYAGEVKTSKVAQSLKKSK